MTPERDTLMIDAPPLPAYDGVSAFPELQCPAEAAGVTLARVAITVTLVVAPFAGLIAGAWIAWGHGFSVTDLVLATVLYVLTGLGVTLGFHRGATHGSFRGKRGLTLALLLAGSMSYQGAVTDWVATHRRHHAFTDRPGDPHSPYRYGTGPWAQFRGLIYAHIGWLLRNDPTPAEKYAPDMLADPMVRKVNNAFPALCVASLVLPAALGFAITGTVGGALTALLWAGLARVALLQHVTWSVNSLCHMVGERPYPTRRFDRATNFWPLAVLSFGESWHNGHHSDPSCARHGRGPHQLDLSAAMIRVFERFGWANNVHWPDSRGERGRRAGSRQSSASSVT
jgi:stearoyl-CoA desaturase (Delta-9 desaturase)